MRRCQACGAVSPGKIGRCPSCRAWTGLGLAAARLAGTLATVIAGTALLWAMLPRPAATPALAVRVTSGVFHLSDDERGTDVSAAIDNPNPVPVHVKVRVRGYDITDRVVVEKVFGPYRHVSPGAPYTFHARLDTTPLKDVTFDAVDVRPIEARPR